MTNHKEVQKIEDCDYCQFLLSKGFDRQNVWWSHEVHLEEYKRYKAQ